MIYLKLLRQSFLMMVFFTILLGIIYPALITGIGKLLFPFQANGSLIYNAQNKVIASKIIGLNFPNNYFQSRPSANNYDAMNSGGSNLSITSEKEINLVKARINHAEALYGKDKKVPADLVFASGSGLDPDISLEAAIYQAGYIAKVNHLAKKDVLDLINTKVDRNFFNLATVNVLELNLALNQLMNHRQ